MVRKSHDEGLHRQAARRAISERRLAEASRELTLHLDEHPDDLEAELERGLVELLRGKRQRFAEAHEILSAKLEASSDSSLGPWQTLWERYQKVAKSTAQAATILALAGMPIPAGLAGCSTSAPSEEPDPSAPIAQPAESPPPPPPSPEAGATKVDAAPPPSVPTVDAEPDGAPDGGGTKVSEARDSGPSKVRPRPGTKMTKGKRQPPHIVSPRPGPITRYIAVRSRPVPDPSGSPGPSDLDEF